MNLDIKYRPNKWDEIVGQRKVVASLRQQIIDKKISNAYLFTGKSGVGKTTLAYLFSKAVNCENSTTGNPCNECRSCKNFKYWITHINGASNRGIDDMRKVMEEMRYKNTFGKYKIIFIDEIASVTKQAFESILTSVEDPPENVIWIFASVEQNRIPKTIQTRCQYYKLDTLSWTEIHDGLQRIVTVEKVVMTDKIIWAIAKVSGNSMRQAIKNFEKGADSYTEETVIDNFLQALDDNNKLWEVFSGWKKKHNSFEDFLNAMKYELINLIKVKLGLTKGMMPYAVKKYGAYIHNKNCSSKLLVIVELLEKISGVYDYDTLSFLTYLKVRRKK